MHQRTNYMNFSEDLWTRAVDLQIQAKQIEEKNRCVFDYVQAVDTECNNSVLHLVIFLGLLNTLENNQRHLSNLLRCHTSRERLILSRTLS